MDFEIRFCKDLELLELQAYLRVGGLKIAISKDKLVPCLQEGGLKTSVSKDKLVAFSIPCCSPV